MHFKALFAVAMLCVVALFHAANAAEEEPPLEPQRRPKRRLGGSPEATDDRAPKPPAVEKGFSVQEVKFASGDPVDESEEKQSSSGTIPIVAGVGACACIALLGAVYMKRRKDDDKLPGEIFTIDDKNSVL
ncbi:unnamed protein product [Hyaloperonospora brassicae]|uniref:RxLR effector candidate protein n=1 Tax=Hyaloperonospora brassicae TaxID=162125 RepID=A0AAV0UYJ4_HYABA|nr:unnamed protein product [Hyaloperonospora brassicae]